MSDPHNPFGPSGPERQASPLERLETLERSLLAISHEVAQLRSELHSQTTVEGTPQAGAAPPVAPASPVQQVTIPSWARDGRAAKRVSVSAEEFESLVGRYGMLALATVAALAAVGTFLGWAISRGMLNPVVRVGLGLGTAAVLAIAGLRLRRRERSFSSSLLGLALAVLHVCAYASGPLLGLVPTWGAFAFAAGTAVALAIFAHNEDDEPLWCVGFGGAAIAPFVTSDGRGSAYLLAAYGAVVLLSACWALRARLWPIAERVLALASALFVGAVAAMPERDGGPLLAIALPFVVGIGGVLPFAAPAHTRTRLRVMGMLAAVAALRAGFQSEPPIRESMLVTLLAAAGVLWLVLVDRTAPLGALPPREDRPRGALTLRDWIDACWLPLMYPLAIVSAFHARRLESAWTFAAASLVMVAFVARRSGGPLRDAGVFGVAAGALAASCIAGIDVPNVLIAGVAFLSVAFVAMHRVWPSSTWLAFSGVSLVASSIAALVQLAGRTAYEYTPFGTHPSGAALGVAAVWVVIAAWTRPILRAQRVADAESGSLPSGDMEQRDRAAERMMRGAAVVWAFAWANVEIAGAWSPTVATLMLITYYAATSALSVGVGRRIGSATVRRAGLALAVLAALVAFRGATALEAVAARIAGYLVTAVFLLGIAYWYRRPGSARREASGASNVVAGNL